MDFEPKTQFEVWIATKFEALERQFNNHLAHHWAVEIALVAALIGMAVKLSTQ